MKQTTPAILALADGTVFHGQNIGAEGETTGEVVFNTSMTGYQEIVSDPSYVYQMLTFTYPHIGNVGVNDQDVESNKVHVSGLIVRELSEHYSSHRAQGSFQDFLRKNKIVGISGLDTRSLVLHLRDHGSQMGVISSTEKNADVLIAKAKTLATMDGLDLAKQVSCKNAYDWTEGTWDPGTGRFKTFSEDELRNLPLVVAYDFGIKYNILRLLVAQGLRVKVVPGTTTAEEVLAMSPDGVFLSNGPGDPAAVDYGINATRDLVGKLPIFGICLGHQILGLALQASTYKLKFGHRGGNHPVRNEVTGKVEITVQNHGFAIRAADVPKGVGISHINLNDQTVEGLDIPDLKAFSVQYHPESSPGPNDAQYLFRRFRTLIEQGR